ncbi:MAG: class I SAM-dependent methyltransferase [Terriglobales bacterium]
MDQVLRDSHNRLHPSLRDPNWLILRQRRKIFQAGLNRLPDSNLAVLDVGGRLQPYRVLLGPRVRRYVSVDPQVTPLVNVAAAGEALPFRDEQFDFVICTQVLEYLPDPRQAASEIRRVLRRGGVAFLSAPSVFVRDNDQECWRFLPEGLRHILRDFEAVEVLPEGNSVTGLFRTLNVFLVFFMKPRFLVPVLQWTVVPSLNLAGWMLERLGGKNDVFAANFSAWARK